MARYIGPVCRLCRREGMKLFLKGERCYTEKCAIEKRNVPPGQHGKPRKAKIVGYGVQLREKQKVKRIYGVLENQFRRYFEAADRHDGHHRRDAAAAARAPPRQRDLPPRASRPRGAQARQLVRHGHFTVNGRKVDIPSYSVQAGRRRSASGRAARENPAIQHALEEVKGRGIPEWLSFDAGRAVRPDRARCRRASRSTCRCRNS